MYVVLPPLSARVSWEQKSRPLDTPLLRVMFDRANIHVARAGILLSSVLTLLHPTPPAFDPPAAKTPQQQIDAWFFIKRYIVLLPILALAAYIIVTNRGCTGVQLFGAGLVGFYWQQLAFLGHDAGHRTHVGLRGEICTCFSCIFFEEAFVVRAYCTPGFLMPEQKNML